jgi:hypothetical protein
MITSCSCVTIQSFLCVLCVPTCWHNPPYNTDQFALAISQLVSHHDVHNCPSLNASLLCLSLSSIVVPSYKAHWCDIVSFWVGPTANHDLCKVSISVSGPQLRSWSTMLEWAAPFQVPLKSPQDLTKFGSLDYNLSNTTIILYCDPSFVVVCVPNQYAFYISAMKLKLEAIPMGQLAILRTLFK